MAEAYIISAVLTVGGRRKGALAGWHPADMAAEALDAAVERGGIEPSSVEDVILGCVTQAGEQAFAFARNAVLASRTLPQSTPRWPSTASAAALSRPCTSRPRR